MIADNRLPNGRWEITFSTGSIVVWNIKDTKALVVKTTSKSFRLGYLSTNDGFSGCIARRIGVKEYYENF